MFFQRQQEAWERIGEEREMGVLYIIFEKRAFGATEEGEEFFLVG